MRPSGPKPREEHQSHLVKPQSARPKPQPGNSANEGSSQLVEVAASKQEEVEETEEQLLERLLNARRSRGHRNEEADGAESQVPQHADTLVSNSLRHEDRYFAKDLYLKYCFSFSI